MTIQEAIEKAAEEVKDSNKEEFTKTWRRLSDLYLERGESEEEIIEKILI